MNTLYEVSDNLITNDISSANQLEIYSLIIKKTVHEFRNLLSIINGYSDILNSSNEKCHHEHEIIAISETTNRIKLLLDQLYYPKSETTTFNINVGKSLLYIITLLKNINRRANITCFFDIPRETHMINIRDLECIFLNILINAIQATSENCGCVYVEFLSHNDYFEIQIHDTGIGIPDNDLDKIFNLFFTTKGENGTGIGLSITLDLIKQLKGSIHVENKDWTTFTICIPK